MIQLKKLFTSITKNKKLTFLEFHIVVQKYCDIKYTITLVLITCLKLYEKIYSIMDCNFFLGLINLFIQENEGEKIIENIYKLNNLKT